MNSCVHGLTPPPDSCLTFFVSSESEHRDQATRSLRGVMRVGLVAKGLLLKGDLDLELVLLCKDKPTISLLKKVSDNLVTQLKVRTWVSCGTCTHQSRGYSPLASHTAPSPVPSFLVSTER